MRDAVVSSFTLESENNASIDNRLRSKRALDYALIEEALLSRMRCFRGSAAFEVQPAFRPGSMLLAENSLTALSTQIGPLQHLRTPHLGHNQSARLPEQLGIDLRDLLYLHSRGGGLARPQLCDGCINETGLHQRNR